MSTPRAYQRVNTATDYDYDFSKFPPFLRMDGIDDSLYTAASIDFTSTDKMTVFAGVHKASNAAQGMLVETGGGGQAGSIFVLNGTGGTPGPYWSTSAVGSSLSLADSPADFAAPRNDVLTASADISTDALTLRANGLLVASSSSDQGTGNYLAYPLYVGARGGASLFFNGLIYSIVVRFGANLPLATIEQVERWTAQKTGVTL